MPQTKAGSPTLGGWPLLERDNRRGGEIVSAGIQTSEFWVTLVIAVITVAGATAGLLTGKLTAEQWLMAMGFVTGGGGVYALARGIAKTNGGEAIGK